jgi:hypothetical protein
LQNEQSTEGNTIETETILCNARVLQKDALFPMKLCLSRKITAGTCTNLDLEIVKEPAAILTANLIFCTALLQPVKVVVIIFLKSIPHVLSITPSEQTRRKNKLCDNTSQDVQNPDWFHLK